MKAFVDDIKMFSNLERWNLTKNSKCAESLAKDTL
jgi:hypothetical protein